jgi:hypothetical protein
MLLDEAVSLVENNGAVATLVLEEPTGLLGVANAASNRVAQLERLVAHRTQIRALGADE